MTEESKNHPEGTEASPDDLTPEEEASKKQRENPISSIFKSEKDIRSSKRRPDDKVLYPNADVLTRPLDPPRNVRRGTIVFLVIAALIGALFLAWYFDGVVNEPKRQEQAVMDSLSQEVSYDLPQLYSLMSLDNASILATLQAAGLNILEMPVKESSSIYELVKLPADVSAAEAGSVYLSGIDHASAAEAAKLLNGAWNLQIDRENGVNMVLHYADFTSKSVDAAVQAAITAEGLNESTIEKSGEDNSGNTYTMGTVEGETGTYSWRVSAIPLSEIYSIKGLPEDAVYVGVRMTS